MDSPTYQEHELYHVTQIFFNTLPDKGLLINKNRFAHASF